jgi:hypothetical protein
VVVIKVAREVVRVVRVVRVAVENSEMGFVAGISFVSTIDFAIVERR